MSERVSGLPADIARCDEELFMVEFSQSLHERNEFPFHTGSMAKSIERKACRVLHGPKSDDADQWCGIGFGSRNHCLYLALQFDKAVSENGIPTYFKDFEANEIEGFCNPPMVTIQ